MKYVQRENIPHLCFQGGEVLLLDLVTLTLFLREGSVSCIYPFENGIVRKSGYL